MSVPSSEPSSSGVGPLRIALIGVALFLFFVWLLGKLVFLVLAWLAFSSIGAISAAESKRMRRSQRH